MTTREGFIFIRCQRVHFQPSLTPKAPQASMQLLPDGPRSTCIMRIREPGWVSDLC
jgi:hypothetical protein